MKEYKKIVQQDFYRLMIEKMDDLINVMKISQGKMVKYQEKILESKLSQEEFNEVMKEINKIEVGKKVFKEGRPE